MGLVRISGFKVANLQMGRTSTSIQIGPHRRIALGNWQTSTTSGFSAEFAKPSESTSTFKVHLDHQPSTINIQSAPHFIALHLPWDELGSKCCHFSLASASVIAGATLSNSGDT